MPSSYPHRCSLLALTTPKIGCQVSPLSYTCCRFAGRLWRRKSKWLQPLQYNQCLRAHQNLPVTSALCLSSEVCIALTSKQEPNAAHSLSFSCGWGRLESHTRSGSVDVPGPLKNLHSHPTIEALSPWRCEGGGVCPTFSLSLCTYVRADNRPCN